MRKCMQYKAPAQIFQVYAIKKWHMCTTNMDFIDVLILTIVAMLKLLKFTQTPKNAVVYFFLTQAGWFQIL